MAKYSTGDDGSGDAGGTCELCGDPADTLREATIAGARLTVCTSCAPHDDTDRGETDQEQQTAADPSASPSADAAHENEPASHPAAGKHSDHGTSSLWDSDTTHWEDGGVNYEDDRLPYLVADYGERVRTAREAAGLTRQEVAVDLGITAQELVAVEQGNAATRGIGGSVITALEDTLDVTLTED